MVGIIYFNRPNTCYTILVDEYIYTPVARHDNSCMIGSGAASECGDNSTCGEHSITVKLVGAGLFAHPRSRVLIDDERLVLRMTTNVAGDEWTKWKDF